MDDLKLLEQILPEFEKFLNIKSVSEHEKCEHTNIIKENDAILCMDCGEEIEKSISLEKEWRYYSGIDNRHTSDPSRCQVRKSEERTIFKDVETLGFSEYIINEANTIYTEVTKKKKKSPEDPDEYKIYRGKSRRSIIFACIFNAYKMSNNPQTCDSLIEIFNLDRKSGLKGLKYVNMNAPKKSPVRTTYITPIHLLDELMDKFNANQEKKKEVLDLYEKIKNKSEKLKRSRPQSTAASLVYYYICLKKLNINIKEFSEKVKLSILTISKLSKEIEDILKTPNVVII